jgi:tRNA 2-selenouridine synthase
VVQGWQAQARAGRWAEVFADLMQRHYDPLYERSYRSSYRQLGNATVLQLRAADATALRQAVQPLLD